MPGLLGTLHTAKSGMTVSQTSIQTVTHNLNNLNTPGYSRQRVEQKEKDAYSYPGYNSKIGAGQLGTGVEAVDIIRIRNTFYDFQFRNESHTQGKINIKYDHYTNMEKIFNEPSDTSISASIANYFSSWQELSKNPTDVASRDIVVQNAKYLADNVSNVKVKLDNLSEQANEKIKNDINDMNDMFNQIKALNKEIRIVKGNGKSPNDLLDQRDYLLDKLSFKMNLENPEVKDALEQEISKVEIVNTAGNKELVIEYGEPTKTKKIPAKEISGELQGSLDMIEKIKENTDKLIEFSKGIVKGVNNVLNGKDANDPITVGAKDLFVLDEKNNPVLTVKKALLEKPRDLDVTTDTAYNMYHLKDKKLDIGNPVEKMTINKFYNTLIQKMGNESQEIIRNEKNQSKIIKEIDNLRSNVSGVSLDEEMVSLIQFQHAYTASAKVISTVDSLLDVVVNGLVK